nr:MAG TPA: CPKC Virion protein N terminal domain [Caudoviricetes sp.]
MLKSRYFGHSYPRECKLCLQLFCKQFTFSL